MFNKSRNFIRRLNRDNLYFFKLKFSNSVANKSSCMEVMKKIQLNTCKITPARPKNPGSEGVDTTIVGYSIYPVNIL